MIPGRQGERFGDRNVVGPVHVHDGLDDLP